MKRELADVIYYSFKQTISPSENVLSYAKSQKTVSNF